MCVCFKVTVLFICLYNLSKCESVLGNFDSITIEIDLDNENKRETTKKSEFMEKKPASDFVETTVYVDNEANARDHYYTITTTTDDLKILSRREEGSEHIFENSAVNEGVENQNKLVTILEGIYKHKEQKDGMDDKSVEEPRSKTFEQKLTRRDFETEPIHTSESLYKKQWIQENSYHANEHENKASITDEFTSLDENVHNILPKTTPDTTLDNLKLNENEIRPSESSYLNIKRIKAITPLTRITDYIQIPTKTTVVPLTFRDSSDLFRESTDLNKDSSKILKESTILTNSENLNTIVESRNEKELTTTTSNNLKDDHINKETVREWIPLNIDKDAHNKTDNTIITVKDEVMESKTVVPITWIPEYESKPVVNDTFDSSISDKIQVTNNNNTIGLNTSTDLETRTETVENVAISVTEKITTPYKINKSINKKCKYAKNVGYFDIDKLTGVLQTVYYTMPDKIPCFKMFVLKLSDEEKEQYHNIYGDFQGRINWTRCDLEIKAETKIKRKHFLQSSESSDGIFENKIIMGEDADADVEETPTLIEDSSDQWSVVNDLVLLRDCRTGRVLFFKRNPRSRVSHRELKKALFAAGEGFNGRLSCRHKGQDEDF